MLLLAVCLPRPARHTGKPFSITDYLDDEDTAKKSEKIRRSTPDYLSGLGLGARPITDLDAAAYDSTEQRRSSTGVKRF